MVIEEKFGKKREGFFMLLLFIVSFFQFHCNAQNRIELEKKKYKNLQEIEYANKLLNETEKTKKISVSKLLVLKSIILNISLEIELLNKRIEEENEIIKNLQNDLERIKNEYAKLIQYAFLYQR